MAASKSNKAVKEALSVNCQQVAMASWAGHDLHDSYQVANPLIPKMSSGTQSHGCQLVMLFVQPETAFVRDTCLEDVKQMLCSML